MCAQNVYVQKKKGKFACFRNVSVTSTHTVAYISGDDGSLRPLCPGGLEEAGALLRVIHTTHTHIHAESFTAARAQCMSIRTAEDVEGHMDIHTAHV